MYHIKDDVRAIKSAELLYEGLIRCMEITPFDQISILDVAKASTVSRTTFYRNFDSLIDVLYWKCDQMFRQVLQDYLRENPDLENADSFFRYSLNFWMQHANIVEVFITQGRIDIIFHIFRKHLLNVDELVGESVKLPISTNPYYISIHVGIFVGIFQTWIDNGQKESADEIMALLHEGTIGNGFVL